MKKTLLLLGISMVYGYANLVAQKKVGISLNTGIGIETGLLKSDNFNNLPIINFDNVKLNTLRSHQVNLMGDMNILYKNRLYLNLGLGMQVTSTPMCLKILMPHTTNTILDRANLKNITFDVPFYVDLKYDITQSKETKLLLRLGAYPRFGNNKIISFNTFDAIQPNKYQVESYHIALTDNQVNLVGLIGAGIQIKAFKNSEISLIGTLNRIFATKSAISGHVQIAGKENLSYDFSEKTLVPLSNLYFQLGYIHYIN